MIPADAPVTMGPGGPAGGVHRSGALSWDQSLAGNNVRPGEREESAVQSMSMVDHQQIALQREGAVGGQDHYPSGGRDDGLARRAGYVDAAMIGARLAQIDALRSEQAGDAADPRPDEEIGRASGGERGRSCG